MKFNENSGKQAATMIRLTVAIIVLTVVIGGIAAMQLVTMLRGM